MSSVILKQASGHQVVISNPGTSGPIFCLLLRVSSDYAQPITGQVTEVTCPVIGRAQPELTPSKRQKTGQIQCLELKFSIIQSKNFPPHLTYYIYSGANLHGPAQLLGVTGSPLVLTHRGRVTHICVSKRTIIGSDNGLSPSRCQAII